uniref:Leucine-rich repeat-containing protein n=1 Tax=Rhizophora mucronata TaxID=61149 RepID=A0A2P2K7P3_RHIMU
MDPKELPILSNLLPQIDQSSHLPNPEVNQSSLTRFRHLNNPKVASLLTQAVPTSLTQTHALLRAMGPRPDPDVVSTARSRMAQVQELGGGSGGGGKEVEIYRAAVRLEEIYEEHERELRDVEERLAGVYREVVEREIEDFQWNEEVVAVLKETQSGEVVERLDLSDRQLTLIPEAFGTLHGLLLLNLSHNQLQVCMYMCYQ